MMFWSFAVLIRGLDVFLLFESVRNYYVILVESFKDSKFFLIIVAYICYVFGLVKSVLSIGAQDKDNLLEMVLNVFGESLGGFEAPSKETIEDIGIRNVFWVHFTLLLIFSMIIGSNSLIAIIGDSYERVQVDKSFYDAVQKNKMLRELNDNFLLLNKIKETKSDPRFVHIVKYADHSVQNKEGHGRIENIQEIINAKVDACEKSIKKDVADVNNKVKKEVADVKEVADAIKREVAEIKEQLQMLINKNN